MVGCRPSFECFAAVLSFLGQLARKMLYYVWILMSLFDALYFCGNSEEYALLILILSSVSSLVVGCGHADLAYSFDPGMLLYSLYQLRIWLKGSYFASTYVGPDSEDNWAALFRLTTLFRRVAMELGAVRKLPRGVEPTHSEDAKA